MTDISDPIELTRALICCPSVTPEDNGALDVLQAALEELGFACTRLPFNEEGTAAVDNLYARLGTERPHFCFAGHTDVVPVGDDAAWSADPFAGEIRDGMIVGRGAADMKGAIAAFVAAVSRFLNDRDGTLKGSISLLITGDEEGPAVNGTRKMLSWLRDRAETIDHCLVGEPTNPQALGDMVKIGRRGSLNGRLTVTGTQGHVAYPDLADNPIPKLVGICQRLTERRLDEGNDHFQPSHLEVTSIDVGNTASNVIPAAATASFNIRFNTCQTVAELERWLHETCAAVVGEMGGAYQLQIDSSGEAFLFPPSDFSNLIVDAIKKQTGRTPELSTTGGTSDARFIKDYCTVAEFGLIGKTMHKVDERTALTDIEDLTGIYTEVLSRYFAP
jgi:succinyl-diaminopimelate desuccinylase